jgi:hypothetical protein
VLVLSVYAWKLHGYMSRPILRPKGEKRGCVSTWCPVWLSSRWSSFWEALGFVWDLCFGDGELPMPEPPDSPSSPHPTDKRSNKRAKSLTQSVEMI